MTRCFEFAVAQFLKNGPNEIYEGLVTIDTYPSPLYTAYLCLRTSEFDYSLKFSHASITPVLSSRQLISEVQTIVSVTLFAFSN